MIKTVYICGPMSGRENFNAARFGEFEKDLLTRFDSVVNPAKLGVQGRWEEFLRRDMSKIMSECDGVVAMDDWGCSRGASLEIFNCLTLGVPVVVADGFCGDIHQSSFSGTRAMTWGDFYSGMRRDVRDRLFGSLDKTPGSVCDEAKALVYGPRGDEYGHPYDDYARTAAIWSAILGVKVDAFEAAQCMIAVKLSRLCHQKKRDSIVDIAGYAECLYRIASHPENKDGFQNARTSDQRH